MCDMVIKSWWIITKKLYLFWAAATVTYYKTFTNYTHFSQSSHIAAGIDFITSTVISFFFLYSMNRSGYLQTHIDADKADRIVSCFWRRW